MALASYGVSRWSTGFSLFVLAFARKKAG